MPVRMSEKEFRTVTKQPEPVKAAPASREPTGITREGTFKGSGGSEPRAPRTVPTVSRSAPRSQYTNPNSGFWNWVFAAVFLLFFLWLIQRGEINDWIKILIYNPKPPPKVAANAQQAADPGYTAIPGQDAAGNPKLFPNSTTQGAQGLDSTGSTAAKEVTGAGALVGGFLGNKIPFVPGTTIAGAAAGAGVGSYINRVFDWVTNSFLSSPAK